MTNTEQVIAPPSHMVRDRIAAAVRMTIADGKVFVTADFRTNIPLGLRIHANMKDTAVRTLMGRSGGRMSKPENKVRRCEFNLADQARAVTLLKNVRTRLLKIARRPISGGQIEELLNISAAERNRWSKSGALRIFGSAQIRRGHQLVSLFTYAPEIIEVLSEAPDIIATWRAEDGRKS